MVVDQSTVDRFKPRTENFISGVLGDIFHKTISEIHMASLINSDALRPLILQAEPHFQQQKFRECIEVCEKALVKATFGAGDLDGKAGLLTGYWGQISFAG